jgi:hypothetical protein
MKVSFQKFSKESSTETKWKEFLQLGYEARIFFQNDHFGCNKEVKSWELLHEISSETMSELTLPQFEVGQWFSNILPLSPL